MQYIVRLNKMHFPEGDEVHKIKIKKIILDI
jgi:hypothetical protein